MVDISIPRASLDFPENTGSALSFLKSIRFHFYSVHDVGFSDFTEEHTFERREVVSDSVDFKLADALYNVGEQNKINSSHNWILKTVAQFCGEILKPTGHGHILCSTWQLGCRFSPRRLRVFHVLVSQNLARMILGGEIGLFLNFSHFHFNTRKMWEYSKGHVQIELREHVYFWERHLIFVGGSSREAFPA